MFTFKKSSLVLAALMAGTSLVTPVSTHAMGPGMFDGLASFVGMCVGSSFGGIFGGVIGGCVGSAYAENKKREHTETNTWEYRTKGIIIGALSGLFAGGALGAFLGR